MFINFVTILFWVPVLIKVFNIPSFGNGANSQWVGSAGRRAEQSSEAETKEAALLWDPRSPMKFCTEMPGRWATVLVAGTAGVCFLDPNFWFWHVLAISYYSMICHEPEINVAKQLSWSYSILSNNRLQVQWGQGMAQKWSPSKRDGSMLHGPQLTDWLIIFLWCPRIRFYFKAKTVQKHLLVGGFNHLEKYDIVNGKDYPIYYGKKTCSKPPTRKLGYLDVQSLGNCWWECSLWSSPGPFVDDFLATWNWWFWQALSFHVEKSETGTESDNRSDCQSVPKRLGSRFEVLEKSLRHVLLQQNGTSTSEVNFDFLSPGTSADISLSLYRSVMTPYCRCWFILMQTPLHDWYTAKRLTVL